MLAGTTLVTAQASAAAPAASRIALTPTLAIAYEETGSPTGRPMVLLHGWPYDPRAYDAVRSTFADAGFRVIVPYLRGFGPTSFRDASTMRSGQQAALGRDVVDLLDALGIGKAVLVGFDWGAGAACIAAALWPERVEALVSCGGYGIHSRDDADYDPGDAGSLRDVWYCWYLNTPMGERSLPASRVAFARGLWTMWSPKTRLDEPLFASSARSFWNPDWVAVTLSCYRVFYGNAPTDPAYDGIERRLDLRPRVGVPTLVLLGDSDVLDPLDDTGDDDRSFFTDRYERRVLANVGHCPPIDGPGAFSAAVLGFLSK